MSRVFSLVLFIALVSGSALALGKDDPADKGAQQEFVNAFLNVRKGEELERTGDLRGALATYLSAAGALAKIKKDSPGWQKDLVDFRLKKTMDAIDRVQTKIGGPAAGAEAGGAAKEG